MTELFKVLKLTGQEREWGKYMIDRKKKKKHLRRIIRAVNSSQTYIFESSVAFISPKINKDKYWQNSDIIVVNAAIYSTTAHSWHLTHNYSDISSLLICNALLISYLSEFIQAINSYSSSLSPGKAHTFRNAKQLWDLNYKPYFFSTAIAVKKYLSL